MQLRAVGRLRCSIFCSRSDRRQLLSLLDGFIVETRLETAMNKGDKAKRKSALAQGEAIERVGAGGEVGEGQSGAPLHKPEGRRDRELGDRERVGAGGLIGEPHYDHR